MYAYQKPNPEDISSNLPSRKTEEMSLLVNSPTFSMWNFRKPHVYQSWSSSRGGYKNSGFGSHNVAKRYRSAVEAFFFNPAEEPVLKEALKEPIAFMGGVFAGVLRLDLNEDPLREWLTRTVEASGIAEEELGVGISSQVEAEGEVCPQQIEIE